NKPRRDHRLSDVTGVPATLQLPLLPLKNVVLFPHMIVPLYVGRERSINALEDAMTKGKQVFLCTQRRADCEDPKEADLYPFGVSRMPGGWRTSSPPTSPSLSPISRTCWRPSR